MPKRQFSTGTSHATCDVRHATYQESKHFHYGRSDDWSLSQCSGSLLETCRPSRHCARTIPAFRQRTIDEVSKWSCLISSSFLTR